jgi:hypothetical protein
VSYTTVVVAQVKATVLNPDQEFSSDRPLTKEDVHRLIAVSRTPIDAHCILYEIILKLHA